MIKIRIGKKMKGSAVAILDDDSNMLLLLRSAKSRWMPKKWGLPGGKVETGEEPVEAAIRETKEEANLNVQNLTYLKDLSDKSVDLFYTTDYDGDVQIDFEHDDYEWVSRADVEQYDTTARIVEIFDWILKNERTND
jgi:8-oxo-dGTP diphosphatase